MAATMPRVRGGSAFPVIFGHLDYFTGELGCDTAGCLSDGGHEGTSPRRLRDNNPVPVLDAASLSMFSRIEAERA